MGNKNPKYDWGDERKALSLWGRKVNSGVDQMSCKFKDAQFTDRNFACANFKHCTFENVTFQGCDLRGVDFSHSVFKRVWFKECLMTNAWMMGIQTFGYNSDVDDPRLRTDLIGCLVTGSQWDGTNTGNVFPFCTYGWED